MRTIAVCILAGWLSVSVQGMSLPTAQVRQTLSFDSDWSFFKGDIGGAQNPDFDDHAWTKVNVPHDWSIEGPISADNPSGGDGGFLPSGISWYRKTFTLPSGWKNRMVFVDFDGVMANSEVWLNGQWLGKRPSGYVSFRYDLTPYLNASGKTNILAVKTDTSLQPASRWYTGAGIYRHVRLIAANPVGIDPWATFVSTPSVADDKASICVTTSVINQTEKAARVSLEIVITDPLGKVAAKTTTSTQSIAAGAAGRFARTVDIAKPQRWDIDNPVLYTAVVKVRHGWSTVDDEVVAFGIRKFRFEPATGFWLNGRNVKIKGACVHHDGGAFGAAVPLQVWRQRLDALKAIGVNAIRTAHNAAAPEFLDLCDRMGFLVMDEYLDVWTVGKRKGDYHLYFKDWALIDTRDMVRRDRNHPSIILYSAGNEIHDTPKAELAKGVLKSLIEIYHQEDPTRPVTQALFRPNQSHDYDNGLADMLDVVGQNYRENEILAAYEQNPKRKIIGTENSHDLKIWLPLRDNPPYAGQFIWTGIDYLGESRQWPAIATPFGLIDRTGGWRPVSYQRQSWWSDTPMVYLVRRLDKSAESPVDPGYENSTEARFKQVLFSDWTPSNLQPHPEIVDVYSNCQDVELFINGKSQGIQAKPADDSPRQWTVTFEPGTIRAVASNGNKVAAVDEKTTAGRSAAIVLAADVTRVRKTWDDVSRIEAVVVDDKGIPVPTAKQTITFTVSGPGVIAAVDNGHNLSAESFRGNRRSAYQGRCCAWIKATEDHGTMTVTAAADGLTSGTITLPARP